MIAAVIGMGSFGSFVAKTLSEHMTVISYDSSKKCRLKNVRSVTLGEVGGADVVVVAVPLAALRLALLDLKPYLSDGTVVVDVCSVKLASSAIIHEVLAGHQEILCTHPLFGPTSARHTTTGHTMVVTGDVTDRAEKVLAFCRVKLGLNVVKMTEQEHDRAMAETHALTLFIARGLGRMNLVDPKVVVPSFAVLTELIGYNDSHSEELFRTTQQGNPFAKDMRERLVASLKNVDKSLD